MSIKKPRSLTEGPELTTHTCGCLNLQILFIYRFDLEGSSICKLHSPHLFLLVKIIEKSIFFKNFNALIIPLDIELSKYRFHNHGVQLISIYNIYWQTDRVDLFWVPTHRGTRTNQVHNMSEGAIKIEIAAEDGFGFILLLGQRNVCHFLVQMAKWLESKAIEASSSTEPDSSSADISQREVLPLQYAARAFCLFSM